MIREEIKETCSIHWYSSRGVGDVFYLIIRYDKEPNMPNCKIGDIRTVYVWVDNSDNSYYKEKTYPFFEYHTEEDIRNLSPISQSDPILVGQYSGSDFYFRGELMTGTPTDETMSTDFLECLSDFNEIRKKVFGTPYWDKETIEITRVNA